MFNKDTKELELRNKNLRKENDTLILRIEDMTFYQSRLDAKNSRLLNELADLEAKFKEVTQENIELKTNEQEHEIDMLEQRKEITEQAHATIKKTQEDNAALKSTNASLQTRVDMMEQVVEISSDIVDIKDLISKLINKLPEVNITGGLTVQNQKSK